MAIATSNKFNYIGDIMKSFKIPSIEYMTISTRIYNRNKKLTFKQRLTLRGYAKQYQGKAILWCAK